MTELTNYRLVGQLKSIRHMLATDLRERKKPLFNDASISKMICVYRPALWLFLNIRRSSLLAEADT